MSPRERSMFDRMSCTIRDYEHEKIKLLIMMYREARSSLLTCAKCQKQNEASSMGYVFYAYTEPGPMGGVFTRQNEDVHTIVCPHCKAEAAPTETESWRELKAALDEGQVDPHLIFGNIYWRKNESEPARPMTGQFWLKHGK